LYIQKTRLRRIPEALFLVQQRIEESLRRKGFAMRIDKDPAKEIANRRKHGLDFSFAGAMFDDPLSLVAYDRFEQGEHRWLCVGRIGEVVLVMVHAYPDPEDQYRVRVISLRRATSHERRRYERHGYN
jgi:uncharacterized DUF497 family protein